MTCSAPSAWIRRRRRACWPCSRRARASSERWCRCVTRKPWPTSRAERPKEPNVKKLFLTPAWLIVLTAAAAAAAAAAAVPAAGAVAAPEPPPAPVPPPALRADGDADPDAPPEAARKRLQRAAHEVARPSPQLSATAARRGTPYVEPRRP